MRPMRPAKPVLLPPQQMQRRRGAAGRAALLHAIAHIEFNAIDLAWDMIARFADPALPRAFYDDWVRVGDEEAKHFLMLSKRMEAFGLRYGDFPAHDGLWQAAQETADDVLSRLAIAPLVLEARGLDVTPAIIDRLTQAGDSESVAILSIILEEEVGHVSIGRRWFTHIATSRGQNPLTIFQTLVRLAFMPTGTNRLSRKAKGNNNAKNIQSYRDFILAFKLQPRGGSTAKRPYSIHFWAGARSLGRNHTRGNRRTGRSSLQKPANGFS